MTRIFGASDDRALSHAIELGTAMQLTNILRDVGEDLQMGRVYLPADEMSQFRYSEEELKGSVRNEAFVALMKFQIQRTREYYARAAAGIPMLSNDGSRFCVHLMSTTYEGILTAIEANAYDVFSRRAYVPLNRKLSIAVASALDPDRDLRVAGPWSGLSVPAGDTPTGRKRAIYFQPAH
jgi:phytoene synthase